MNNIIQFPDFTTRQNPGLGVPNDRQAHSGSSALALNSKLDAPVSQPKSPKLGLGVPKDKESQKYRPTLKVRLRAADRPIIDITEAWRAKNACAANVAAAIRFYDAYLRGDAAAMRQECPMLTSLLAGDAPKRKKSLPAPVLDSSSNKDALIEDQNQDQEGASCKQLALKIAEVTLVDYLVNKKKGGERSSRTSCSRIHN